MNQVYLCLGGSLHIDYRFHISRYSICMLLFFGKMTTNRLSRSFPSVLATSRLVVKGLVVLNLVLGTLVLALLIASLIARDQVFAALGADVANARLIYGMRLIMVIGIGSAPIAHVLLTHLLSIVETVRFGDPFVSANAARLQTTAWALMGLELLHLTVGAIAKAA